MKHIKTFENKIFRQVYWIVPFNKKFEDSLVRLITQYTPVENMEDKIRLIDEALKLANTTKQIIPKDDFVILTLKFRVDDDIPSNPIFDTCSMSEKNKLDKQNYIFVGFFNTNKEEYEDYLIAKKYNM